jgi:uncharacterized damage-inducible protein DinB
VVARPTAAEYESGTYVDGYLIQLIDAEDAIRVLREQTDRLLAAEKIWTDEQLDHRYAPGKWSVRQMLGHLIDTERIFAYRALAIARGETQSLPGFDENAYQDAATFDQQSKETLFRHYELVRKSNLWLFETFNEAVLDRQGIANGRKISVRTLIWLLAGHERHHFNVLHERYQLPV